MRRYLLLISACLILVACQQETVQEASVYTLYLPIIMTAPGPVKGVAGGSCEDVAAVGGRWRYGWMPQINDCPNIEDVPMIGNTKAMGQPVGGDSAWLMGFNEPDWKEQANIPPKEAAIMWRQIEALYPTRLLVAPAPSCARGGEQWLVNFYNEYRKLYGRPPRLDALAVHCYNGLGDTTECKELVRWYLRQAQTWGVAEVWVTEFGFQAWRSDGDFAWGPGLAAMDDFIQFLNEQPGVTRYAWFTARMRGDEWWSWGPDATTALFDDGGLTPFGKQYRGY